MKQALFTTVGHKMTAMGSRPAARRVLGTPWYLGRTRAGVIASFPVNTDHISRHRRLQETSP